MIIGLIPSIIAALALVAGAFVTFMLNRRMSIEAAWRTERLTYYKELVNCIGTNVEGDSTDETDRAFARASNNILLIASPDVLRAHNAFRAHIRISNPSRDYDKDDQMLADLLNSIRSDLRMPRAEIIKPDDAKLWASGRRRNPFANSQ